MNKIDSPSVLSNSRANEFREICENVLTRNREGWILRSLMDGRTENNEYMAFKNKLCQNHLGRPGFKHGDRACSCRRHAGHKGRCRAAGRWEWNPGASIVYDRIQKVWVLL